MVINLILLTTISCPFLGNRKYSLWNILLISSGENELIIPGMSTDDSMTTTGKYPLLFVSKQCKDQGSIVQQTAFLYGFDTLPNLWPLFVDKHTWVSKRDFSTDSGVY